ncbi:hypothetical protein INR49_021213 [Caranx melampygus]|nr:hypothetical protein INR49_023208 [Caranx melampygus]KAG7217712.1 hypothetical protein INR49_021213 [Caranx melampygus]
MQQRLRVLTMLAAAVLQNQTSWDHKLFEHDSDRPGPGGVQTRLYRSPLHPTHTNMSECDPPAVEKQATAGEPGPGIGRPPLAEKALSESYARARYRDTSLLIWSQQQQELQVAPPSTYLNRSQSTWYSSYGNQAVLVRDKRGLEDVEGQSRICSIM